MDSNNLVYIYDADRGKLIICNLPLLAANPQAEYEERIRAAAETNDMQFGDCEWGGVREISINI